jgi:hypothetical protein
MCSHLDDMQAVMHGYMLRGCTRAESEYQVKFNYQLTILIAVCTKELSWKQMAMLLHLYLSTS